MSIYADMKALNVPMDHHESDLYVKVTPETTALVQTYKFRTNIAIFQSQIDKTLWYDIPFAYEPFWEHIMKRGGKP